MAQVIDDPAEALRSGFEGTVLVPGDDGYDAARTLWNGAIDRRPALVAQCAGARDVARAIAVARERGLEIAVRGGGHSYSGSSVVDDGLMIDLSRMNTVSVDPAARRAVCGGGATWKDVDGATQEHALAAVGGFISHTGIGGLTLGGGIGHLSRRHGLACDNLTGAEVVTAGGEILRASAEENADLFWAIRGGGGNFGVVTSMEFRLHPVGPMVDLALLAWPVAHGVEALQVAREVAAGVSDDVSPFIGGLSLPPAPFVPEEHHGATVVALVLVGFGATAEHAALVQRASAALTPMVQMVTPIPYTALQQMFDESAPWGIHAYEKSLWLEGIGDEAAQVIVEHLGRKGFPLSFMPAFLLGGEYARQDPAATAFAGPRGEVVCLNIASAAPSSEIHESERAWVRAFWDAMRPFARSAASYVNFMAEYDEERVIASYGREKYDRLASIKAAYDPDNVFHRNINIRPAGRPAG